MIVDAVTIQEVDGLATALFAEQVLDRMHQEVEVNPLVRPNVITYNSVINAWTKSGLPEGPKKGGRDRPEYGEIWVEPYYNFFQHNHRCMGQEWKFGGGKLS
jgi:hypothetical protein